MNQEAHRRRAILQILHDLLGLLVTQADVGWLVQPARYTRWVCSSMKKGRQQRRFVAGQKGVPDATVPTPFRCRFDVMLFEDIPPSSGQPDSPACAVHRPASWRQTADSIGKLDNQRFYGRIELGVAAWLGRLGVRPFPAYQLPVLFEYRLRFDEPGDLVQTVAPAGGYSFQPRRQDH